MVARAEPTGSKRDAARQAALDERDRLGAPITSYVTGRIVEAALAVWDGRPVAQADEPETFDIDEVTDVTVKDVTVKETP